MIKSRIAVKSYCHEDTYSCTFIKKIYETWEKINYKKNASIDTWLKNLLKFISKYSTIILIRENKLSINKTYTKILINELTNLDLNTIKPKIYAIWSREQSSITNYSEEITNYGNR